MDTGLGDTCLDKSNKGSFKLSAPFFLVEGLPILLGLSFGNLNLLLTSVVLHFTLAIHELRISCVCGFKTTFCVLHTTSSQTKFLGTRFVH